MSESTATAPDPAQKEALQTEAAELQTDVTEAKQELQQAKADGDDARVAKLEASITATNKDLSEIKATLKQLVERPFAPAPGDGEQQPAAPAGEQQTTEQTTTETEQPEKPKKGHWLYGSRWNQE